MGSRLKRLQNEMQGKIEQVVNHSVAREGLTVAVIDSIQVCYGKAVRENTEVS